MESLKSCGKGKTEILEVIVGKNIAEGGMALDRRRMEIEGYPARKKQEAPWYFSGATHLLGDAREGVDKLVDLEQAEGVGEAGFVGGKGTDGTQKRIFS